jgi:hypothetical protein
MTDLSSFMTSTARFSISRWRRFLGLTTESPTLGATRLWFAFSMVYALVCAALALRQAFSSEYVLADDVRHHIFWMFRFLDLGLFPNDPIADYFQSIAPPGFAALYRFLAVLGMDPLRASKFIPFGLGLLAAGYLFGIALRVLRSPAAAAVATVLLCQCLWLSSDLSSATPRAFFYPLFAAFLYYHVCGHRFIVLLTILLQGLLFPPAALLSLGVLGLDLVELKNGWPTPSKEPQKYFFLIGALAVAVLTIFPFLHTVDRFGPLVTREEARAMPEFGPGGRVPFFYPDFWNYWVHGSGGLHIQSRPGWLFAAFLWPIFCWFPRYFPLLDRIAEGARPLLQIAGSALLLFSISHLLLFRLYLPSRYTQHASRVLFALAAAGVIMAIVDSLLRWAEARAGRDRPLSAFGGTAFASVLLLWIVCYPLFLSTFPKAGYITGKAPDLYRFFAAQPATIRIASLADEANNLPVFCRRSIVFGVETAVPFHWGYYQPLRQRGLQIARAQYSSDLAVIQQCLRDQKIDFWLLDRGCFKAEYIRNNRVIRQVRAVVPDPGVGDGPLLSHPPPQAVVFATKRFIVLDAGHLLALKSPSQ